MTFSHPSITYGLEVHSISVKEIQRKIMEINQNFIEQLIKNSTEESSKLEFKAAEGIKNSNAIAKQVSAMANASGGLLIYGIKEKNHIADKLDFIGLKIS